MRFQMERGSAQLHSLGPRALCEFLTEVGAAHDCLAAIVGKLTVWRARLTPEMITAAGADRFPPSLSVVPSP